MKESKFTNFLIFRSSIKNDQILKNIIAHDVETDKFILNLIYIHSIVAASLFPFIFSNYILGITSGILISLISFLAYKFFKGTTLSKVILSSALLMFTFIFIQQSYGRIESHFHFWIVLGILVAYLDIRPIIIVSAVIAIHHVLLNYCQDNSIKIFNADLIIYETGASWITTIIHASFVVPSTIIFAHMVSRNIANFKTRKLQDNKQELQNSNLQSVIVDLMQSISVISDTRKDLLTVANRLSNDADIQTSATEEVINSINEIIRGININRENASKTNEITKESVKNIEESGILFNKALDSIMDITKKISIISDISFQTNLLSLNASIQAAKAGKFGKGFNVVAEEVRLLAEKSNIASVEISKLSKSTVNVTNEVGTNLEKVVSEVNYTSELVDNISRANEEQKLATSIAEDSLKQLGNITVQNSVSAQSMLVSIEKLDLQVNQLLKAISGIELR